MPNNGEKAYLPIFNAIVKELIDNQLFNNMTISWAINRNTDRVQSRTPSTGQYSKAVYWFGFHFVDRDNLKDKSIIGMHIKPYCVIDDNIDKAKKSCTSCHKFNEQDYDFVDLDYKTFNIHKYPNTNNLRFQVVLVQNNGSESKPKEGPGKKPEGDSIDFFEKNIDLEKKKKCIKTDWYFPQIQKETEVEFFQINWNKNEEENKKAKEGLRNKLTIDIINAMHTVLEDDAFKKYVNKIDINYLGTLEESKDQTLNESAKVTINQVLKELRNNETVE